MIDSFLGDAFDALSSPFWSTVPQCGARLLIHALNCRYTPASFLTGSLFECGLAHRRSVAVLCTLYKIRCNPMHPLEHAVR